MARYDDPYDVIVAGAGVIGCAVARELAADHDVLVLDRNQVASETTAKASGLITTIPDIPMYPEACRYTMRFFQDFDGTGHFTFTPRRSVHLVTEDEAAWATEKAEDFRTDGFEVVYRPAEELIERYPDVFRMDEFVGGLEYMETGWVDPYTYAMTLKEAAEERGAEFVTGVGIDSIVGNGTVDGVSVAGELIRADTVVCATGWRTRSLLAEHLEVPVRPFRWQTVNLEVDREFGQQFPMGWDRKSGLYWRPEHNGDLHVGGGTYFVDEPGDVRDTITDWFRRHVANMISGRIQDIGDARVASEDCCPTGDAATPDDHPIVDAPAEAPDGLVIAIAGSVGGIMSSPFIARAARGLVGGDGAPFPISHYSIDRFDDRSDRFRCQYVTGRARPDDAP